MGTDSTTLWVHGFASAQRCLHDLRAEFASQLSEAKVPVEQVRDALGHSSITMTNAYLRSRRSLKEAYQKRTQHQARQRMKIVGRR